MVLLESVKSLILHRKLQISLIWIPLLYQTWWISENIHFSFLQRFWIFFKYFEHLFSPKEFGEIGPQMSVWTSCRGFNALNVDSFGKLFRWCLPSRHSLHDCFGWLMKGSLFTNCCLDNNLRLPKFKCPYLMCHYQDGSLIFAFKHFTLSTWAFRRNIRFFVIWTFIISFLFWSLIQR